MAERDLAAGPVSLSNYPDLSERTYQVIKDEIVTGRLPLGSRLVVVELARQLGVSRSPVKDALKRLAGEGLVEQVPRKGFAVSMADREGFGHLLEVRLILELAAAQRGIDLLEPAELAEMDRLAAEMEHLVDEQGCYVDYVQFTRADSKFHTLIVGTARNPYLLHLYRNLNFHMVQMRMHVAVHLGDRRAVSSLLEHRAIVEAFRDRNRVAAEAALTQHIRNAREAFLSVTPD